MKKTKQKIVLFFYFVGLIALGRIIPHPPNFTPVIAIAVFMPYLTRSLSLQGATVRASCPPSLV